MIRKRSVTLSGHRTSFSLEDEFFSILNDMAKINSISLAQLIAKIDAERGRAANLSSALRVAVLLHVLRQDHLASDIADTRA